MKPLLGFVYDEPYHYITQASQNINFAMTKKGASVDVKVIVKMTRSLPKVFIIDGEFTVWAVSKGGTMPYFAGVMSQDAFC